MTTQLHPMRGLQCPSCGGTFDFSTSSDPKDQDPPRDGDLGICIGCGEMVLFEVQMTVRPLPEELRASVQADARTREAVETLRGRRRG